MPRGFCLASDEGCGNGKCIENGTSCECRPGYVHDQLGVLYNNCFMPAWIQVAFPVSIAILSLVALLLSLQQYRRARMKTTKSLFATTSVGLASIIAYAFASSSVIMTNIGSWTLYLVMMIIHICVLTPMVARFLIPPAYRTVLVFPKWYDASLAFFVAFACITLIYAWVFALVGLSMRDKTMFNSGIHIWFGACAWLSFQLMVTVLVAIKQLIEVVDHIFPRRDPFFKDLSSLRRRAVQFRAVAWVLGGSSFVMLFTTAFLHFYTSIFAYRFILFWILMLELIAFDAFVIWFARTGGSQSAISTPKSNIVMTILEAESGSPQRSATTMANFRGNSMAMTGDPTSVRSASAGRRVPQVNVMTTGPIDRVHARKSDETFVDVAVV